MLRMTVSAVVLCVVCAGCPARQRERANAPTKPSPGTGASRAPQSKQPPPPRSASADDEHPDSRAPCRIDREVCGAEREADARKLGNSAFSALKGNDPARAACLAERARRAAAVAKQEPTVAAAEYTLGRAFDKLGCTYEALFAYRRSLCLRSREKAAPKAIKATLKACQSLSRNDADCDSPCGPPKEKPAPAALGSAEESAPRLKVHTGQQLGAIDIGALCAGDTEEGSPDKARPCIEALRKTVKLSSSPRAEMTIVVLQDPSNMGAAVVFLRKEAAGHRVTGTYREGGITGAGKTTELVVDDVSDGLVRLSTKNCNADLDYDDDGVVDAGDCDEDTITLSFDDRQVWLKATKGVCRRCR
jgi:hypothetical protein